MCEAHAFLIKAGQKELLIENVDEVEVGPEEIRLVNIFGEQRIIRAKFLSYSGSKRELLFEAR